jgi:hypothetical protein
MVKVNPIVSWQQKQVDDYIGSLFEITKRYAQAACRPSRS